MPSCRRRRLTPRSRPAVLLRHIPCFVLIQALAVVITGCDPTTWFQGDCGRMSAAASVYQTGEESEWCGADYDSFGMYHPTDNVYELFPDSLDSLENDAVLWLIPTPQAAWWGSAMQEGARYSFPDSLAGVGLIYNPDYNALVSVAMVEGQVEVLSGPKTTDYGTVYRIRWSLFYDDGVQWIRTSGEDEIQFSHTESPGVVVYPPGSP